MYKMIDDRALQKQLECPIEKTDLSVGKKEQKLDRDYYSSEDTKICIATDRVFAFQRCVGTIPFKGQIITSEIVFFAKQAHEIVQTDFLKQLHPNIVVVKNIEKLPLSFVVYGFMANSDETSPWMQYQKGVRNYYGSILPAGLKENQKLETIITVPLLNEKPVAKEMIIAEGLLDEDLLEDAGAVAGKLFAMGTAHAAKQGLLLVQATYEFALENGKLVLLHGFHLPDHAKYWDAREYDKCFATDAAQKVFQQSAIQEWLRNTGFAGNGPAPPLPDAVRIVAAKQYISLGEKLLGKNIALVSGNQGKEIEKAVKEFSANEF